MTNLNIDSSIRIRHIRCTQDPNRVLTIATQLLTREGGTEAAPSHYIQYGFSVNAPARVVKVRETDTHVEFLKKKGDQFSRGLSRTIALGRMRNPRTSRGFYINLNSEHPYEKVLQHISGLQKLDDNKYVQASRMAKDTLEAFHAKEALFNQSVAASSCSVS